MASTVGWFYNEGFKYAAAEGSERGVRLVGVQHGGSYGMSLDIPPETHELEISDRYFVNGWASDKPAKCHDLPDPRMSALFPDRWNPESKDILFLSTGQYYLLYRFHSCPVCDQWLEYADWEKRFFGKLGERLKDVLFRPYPHEYGLRLTDRLKAIYPELRCDDRSKRIYSRLKNTRITVIDHSGTGMLETLSADLPTILFWNPNHWEIRPEARSKFELLRSAKILWDTPEEAAAHLLRVYDKVEEWWRGRSVQDARLEFVNRFALTDPQWVTKWADAFRNEVSLSTQVPYRSNAVEKT